MQIQTITCGVCGGIEAAPHFFSNKLLRCVKCGMVELSKDCRMSDVGDYYAEAVHYSRNIQSLERTAEMERIASSHLDVLERHITPEGKKLLDVGANYGRLVKEANKRGFEASGVEKNRLLVASAKNDGVNVFEGDVLQDDFGKFDVITIVDVLEHIDNYAKVIRRISDSLNIGGLLYLEVPNIASFLAKKDKESWKYVALEHVNYFNPSTIKKLLNQNDLKVIKCIGSCYYLNDFSISYLLHYFVGSPLSRDRFVMKVGARKSIGKKIDNPVKRIIKYLLIFFIRLFRREDLITVIAKKQF